MRLVAIALAVTSCDEAVGVVWGGDHGEVFICDTPCTKPDGTPGYEWCWDGTEAEIEQLKGDVCRPIELSDRLWPALVGCAYGASGAGANAHCGAFVP